MKYSKKIEKLRQDLWKEFKRKDETFEMSSIRSIINDLETGNYDKDKYNKVIIEIMIDYLFTRYVDKMKIWKETIKEREKRERFY